MMILQKYSGQRHFTHRPDNPVVNRGHHHLTPLRYDSAQWKVAKCCTAHAVHHAACILPIQLMLHRY